MSLPTIDLQYLLIHSFQQEIITKDQFTILATCYEPAYARDEVILIGSAIGVHQEYYRAFARFLAGKGYIVYTFDYRGIGKSRPVSLKHLEVSMQEWGKYDLDAVVKHIRSKHSCATLTYIGHSISGQILSLTEESSYFSKVVVVASQHMNWRLWPIHLRFTYAFLIYVLMPLMSHVLGYYPGKALKIFWDLPKGVALEWARWCRHRKGMFGFHSDKPLNAIRVPLLAIGFSDDAIAPLQPRAQFKNLLWEPVLDWLEQTERFDKPLMGSLFSNQMECMDVFHG
jgi:predicted alpha/beta hydrolase